MKNTFFYFYWFFVKSLNHFIVQFTNITIFVEISSKTHQISLYLAFRRGSLVFF